MDKMVQKPNYVEELLEILRGSLAADELQDQISDYHESDIADAFEQLTEEERKRLYPLLGPEWIAEIFTYIEDPDEYLKELDLGQAAQVLSYMDSDDAVDVLDELDDTTQEKLVGMMDEESSHDIKMLQSYEDDEVGSLMTTNFIVIHENLTIRQAMRELIRQADDTARHSCLSLRASPQTGVAIRAPHPPQGRCPHRPAVPWHTPSVGADIIRPPLRRRETRPGGGKPPPYRCRTFRRGRRPRRPAIRRRARRVQEAAPYGASASGGICFPARRAATWGRPYKQMKPKPPHLLFSP